jgi:hypothetical protein
LAYIGSRLRFASGNRSFFAGAFVAEAAAMAEAFQYGDWTYFLRVFNLVRHAGDTL